MPRIGAGGSSPLTDDQINKCLAYMRGSGGVTFLDLSIFLEELGLDVAGKYTIEPIVNLVVWWGASLTFLDAVEQLRPYTAIDQMSELDAVFCVTFTGIEFPHVPYAKAPPRGGYKHPHWAWCTLTVRGEQ